MEYPTDQYKDFYNRVEKAVEGIDLKLEDKKYSMKVTIRAYPSNVRYDLDNSAKPTLDALQKLLNFNDCHVYELHLFKEVVKKGDEKTEVVIESNIHD